MKISLKLMCISCRRLRQIGDDEHLEVLRCQRIGPLELAELCPLMETESKPSRLIIQVISEGT